MSRSSWDNACRETTLFLVFVACVAMLCAPRAQAQQQQEDAPPAEVYRIVALDYADAMLEEGRDRYRPKDTPLFATTLNRSKLTLATDLPGVEGVRSKDRTAGAANPMYHQQLYMLLYELSESTGEAKYERAVDEALTYFFKHTQNAATGFLPWGEHLGWDLQEEAVVDAGQGELTHEMKLWTLWPQVYRLAAEAAVRFARGLWRHQVRPEDASAGTRPTTATTP